MADRIEGLPELIDVGRELVAAIRELVEESRLTRLASRELTDMIAAERSRGDEFTAPGSMAGSFRALREIVPNKWAPVVPHPKRGARRTSKGKVR
jgi:hypothetical protein